MNKVRSLLANLAATPRRRNDLLAAGISLMAVAAWWGFEVDAWKVLTLVVGFFAARISYAQAHIASEKLKLDLFDKRHAVFRGFQDVFMAALRKGNVGEEELSNFRLSTSSANFLFGKDIEEYKSQVDLMIISMMRTTSELNGLLPGERRSALVKSRSDDLRWMLEQGPVLKEKFGKYMRFEDFR